MLVIHNLVQEIVDIDFRSRINNRLYLVEQLSKFKALRLGQFIKCNFPVDGLNNGYFQFRLIGNRTHP